MSVKDDSELSKFEAQFEQVKVSKSSLNSCKSHSENFEFSADKLENPNKKLENSHQRSDSSNNKSLKTSPNKNFIKQNIQKVKPSAKPDQDLKNSPTGSLDNYKEIDLQNFHRKKLEDCKSFKDFKNSQEGEKLSLLLKDRFSKTNSSAIQLNPLKSEIFSDFSESSANNSVSPDKKFENKHFRNASSTEKKTVYESIPESIIEKSLEKSIEKSVEKGTPKRSSSRQNERPKNSDVSTGFRSQQVLTIKFIKEFNSIFDQNFPNLSEIDINGTISLLQELNFIKNDSSSAQFDEETRLVYSLWKKAQGISTVKKDNLLILCLQVMNLYNLKLNLNDLHIEPFKNAQGMPELNHFTPEDSLKIHKTFFSFYSNRQLCIVKKRETEKKDEECTFKPKINGNSESLAKDTYQRYGPLESKEREEHFMRKKQLIEEQRQQNLKEKQDYEIKDCTFKPKILNKIRNTSKNMEKTQKSPLRKLFNKSHDKISMKTELNLELTRGTSPEKRNKDQRIFQEIQRIRNEREKKDKNTEKIINEKQKSNSKSPAPRSKNAAPVKPVNISDLVLDIKNESLNKSPAKDLTDFIKITLAKQMFKENNNIKENASMEETIEQYIEKDLSFEGKNEESLKNTREKPRIDEQDFEKIEQEIEQAIIQKSLEESLMDDKAQEVKPESVPHSDPEQLISAESLHKQKELELEEFIKESNLPAESAEKLRQILRFSK